MSASPFSSKDTAFLLQGINALQQETQKQKATLVQRLFPEDSNLHSLMEYYDKREGELRALKIKILNTVNA
jgi:hypothetical protein